MKEVKVTFAFVLFAVIALCSFLIATAYSDDKEFLHVFWGSVILVAAILICFSICVCKEKDTEVEMLERKMEKLDNHFPVNSPEQENCFKKYCDTLAEL